MLLDYCVILQLKTQLLTTNILVALEIDENAVGKETDEDPQREIYLAKDCRRNLEAT